MVIKECILIRMSTAKQHAKVKCPKCEHKTKIEVPKNACLQVYKCEGCNEFIPVPKNSENCCVVCEYSDNECPMPNKHKKQ